MKNKNYQILIDGSLGLDIIFSVENSIKDSIHIKNGVLQKQNLMFTANSKKEYFGGTGGNIAYGLGILGAKPLLFSAVGKDFAFSYKKHLKKKGIDLRLFVDYNGYLATFYGITDSIGEQIGIWQPNAYTKIDSLSLGKYISKKDFKNISIAIFSPGTPKSILKHLKEFKKNSSENAMIIFDPGQVSLYFNKDDLLKCLDLCTLFIANEIEFNLIENKIGDNLKNYLIQKNKNYIETKGENGSEVYWGGKKIQIPITKPKKILEPTGAGDAYRAGLIFGLWQGVKIEKACLLGAKIAAKSLEYHGSQEYFFKKPLL